MTDPDAARALIAEGQGHDAAMTRDEWEARGQEVWSLDVDHPDYDMRLAVVGRVPTEPHAPVNQRDAPANTAGIAWLRNNLRPLLDALEAALVENERLQRDHATAVAATRQQ
jgi:hypothetical protein